MDLHVTISKEVDLAVLTKECKVASSLVTGLSLNAGTDLTVYGGDDLTEAQVLSIVDAHVKPIKISDKQQLKNDIDASPSFPPATKAILKRLIDVR